ncbi:hypothetical protein IQ64_36575 [Streptomyces stelliscabiei]|nr:hypothetical protein IQ64_36575 [Streptomyces stelliscabiei]
MQFTEGGKCGEGGVGGYDGEVLDAVVGGLTGAVEEDLVGSVGSGPGGQHLHTVVGKSLFDVGPDMRRRTGGDHLGLCGDVFE